MLTIKFIYYHFDPSASCLKHSILSVVLWCYILSHSIYVITLCWTLALILLF